MKLVSFLYNDGIEQCGMLIDKDVYPTSGMEMPGTMATLLNEWDKWYPRLKTVQGEIAAGRNADGLDLDRVHLLAPVPYPRSCRDGYAFRQHVATARRNRKVPMIPEFDMYPIFYFTNHNSIQGPGAIKCMPDHFQKLDFELEVAIVIGKGGRNIKAAEADAHIAGLMIMNDLSARTLQMEEMLLNLGPAKGKDFSTVIGPWLVTLDELRYSEVAPKLNHVGRNWNLKMTCSVNGVQVSEGNLGDMDWTFAEIIERASYGVDLYPGDVIGSGTVGTGCFLELNGTGKLNDPGYKEQWLQEGDEVVMEVESLGVLRNTIVAEHTDWSILALKKSLIT